MGIETRDTAPEEATAEQDSTADKLAREAALLFQGTTGGLAKGLSEMADNPVPTGLQLAASVGVGCLLGYAQRGAPLTRLAVEVAGAAGMLSFVTDVMGPGKLGQLGQAMSDTWKAPNYYDRSLRQFQSSIGRFEDDVLLNFAAGGLGAKAGSSMRAWSLSNRGTTVSEILAGMKGDYGKWDSGRRVANLPKAFETFPHKAVGPIENGKDQIVIELTKDRVLHILKNPMPPEAGKRFFDLPILEKGSVADGRLNYFIQPKVEVVQSREVANQFAKEVRAAGYNFWDFHPTQLGYYKGQVKLIDYDAVAKLTFPKG